MSIANKKVGYVESASEIDKYINEKIEEESDKNIAFVDLLSTPILKLELVNRSAEFEAYSVKEAIEKEVAIEYTNYAISIDGTNKTFVASKEEAENIVKELKTEFTKKYINKLGIVQVYSETYEEISSVSEKDAKKVISSLLKKQKQADIKLAAAKKAAASSNVKEIKSVKVTKIAKETSVNGIILTVKPVSGIITSRFGGRSSPGGIGSTNHKGLDIAASAGTPIFAAAGGKVTFAGTKGALGKLVIISHGNGVQTYYGHCSKLLISKGQTVSAGDKLALVGQTGAATGPHLHLEIHINGKAVNPQKYIY